MKKISKYEIVNGTAIALDSDFTERQDALFIHKTDDENGDGDMVAFGYDMPEDESDLRNIFEDSASWTTNWEVLSTFTNQKEVWSVELEATEYADDTFCGTFED